MLQELRRVAAASPDAPAIVQTDVAITRAQLIARVDRLAAALEAAGVGPGSALAVGLPNCREQVLVFLAAARIGARCLFLPASATRREVGELRDAVGGSVAVTIGRAVHRLPHETVLTIDGAEPPSTDAGQTVRALAELIETASDQPNAPAPDPSEIVSIHPAYRGLGQPVLLSHPASSWAAAGAALGEALELEPGDVVVSACPFDQALPMLAAVVAPLLAGSQTVVSKHPRADDVFDLIAARGGTVVAAPPSFYQLLRASFDPARHRIGGVREWLAVGPPTVPDLPALCDHDLGIRPRTVYGPTEALVGLLEAPSRGRAARRRPGAVAGPRPALGGALPGTTVTIVGLDGEPVADGVHGTIRVEPPWGRASVASPNAPAGASPPPSGDLGLRDTDGVLRYVGPGAGLVRVLDRAVDLDEIASFIAAHPAVERATARATPDEFYGFLVEAEVALTGETSVTVAELFEHLKTHLAYHKVPTSFRFVHD